MMEYEDTAALLVLISHYDQRTVGERDIEAWHAVAEEGSWPSFEVARRAVIKHQAKRPDDRIRPGHVGVIIDEARRSARGSYSQPPTPRELRNQPDAQQTWLAARYREHVARWLAAWADGNTNPGSHPPELTA